MRKYILGLVLIFAAGYSNSAALNTRTLTPTVTTSLTFTDTFTHTPTNTPTDSLTPTKTKTPTFTKTFTNTRTPIPYGAGGASEDTLRKVATELARGNSAYSPTPTPTSLTTTPTPVFTTTMTGTLGVLLTTTPSPTPTLTSTALTHTPSMTKTYTPEGKVVVVVFASKTNTPIPWCPSASMTSTLTPNSTYIVASCTPTLTPLAQDVNVRSMPSPYTTAIHNVEVRNAVANAQAVRTALPEYGDTRLIKPSDNPTRTSILIIPAASPTAIVYPITTPGYHNKIEIDVENIGVNVGTLTLGGRTFNFYPYSPRTQYLFGVGNGGVTIDTSYVGGVTFRANILNSVALDSFQ